MLRACFLFGEEVCDHDGCGPSSQGSYRGGLMKGMEVCEWYVDMFEV